MADDDLTRAKNGDPSALNELLNKYKHLAYSVAFKYAQDKEDAADIVQESFIKVFLNIQKFKSESLFSTWLFKIVYHESIKFVQSKKLYVDLNEANTVAAGQERQEDGRIDEIKRAMRGLTEKEYMMVNLFYLGEKNIKVIAGITNESAGNVKVILHRARKKLTEFLTIT